MDLVPRHPKNLRKHSLYQVMAHDCAFGDLPALGRKPNASVAPDRNQTILGQPFQREGYSGSGHREPVSESSRNNGLSFGFRFGNSF